jgi:hypothetical protein
MPFPLSAIGSIRLDVPGEPGRYVEPVRNEITVWLKDKRARTYIDESQIIRFQAGAFRFVTNMNVLAAIRSGEVELVAEDDAILVSYRFWFTELLIIATVGALGFVGPVFFSAPNLDVFEAGELTLLVWAFLLVPNFLLYRYFAVAGLKNVARDAIRKNSPPSTILGDS